MDLEIFNQAKKIHNNPIIDTKLIENKHLIFIKYTSEIYYKYTIELIETLCKKSKYENKKLLFHTTLTFLLKILYNCGNIPCLNNYDLLILCVFSLGVKSTVNQKKSPSLNKLKRIYPEKYSCYENEEIKIGEVICIKLLDYNITILTSYECLFYLLNKYNNLYLLDYCIQELDNIIFLGAQKYVFKRPIDIAKESIEKAKFKEKQRKNINNNINEKTIENNSKGRYNNNKNTNKNPKPKRVLPNNESISTNASSTANISNYGINGDKNIYYSAKSKSIIKNKLKDINNNSRKKTIIREDKDEEINDKKVKLNIIYSNIEKNDIYISPEKRKYNYTNNINNNNIEYRKKTNKKLHFKNYNKNKNSDSLNNIDTEIDNDNNGNSNIILLKRKEIYQNCSSPNIFKKPVKVYKKNLKYDFSDSHKLRANLGTEAGGEKFKNAINYKIKNTIFTNRINNFKLNNNMNFNYDKLSELCHKMNFDVFNNKNEINV